MQVAKRTSANAVIKAVMSTASAVGVSKSISKSESSIRGQNGHKVSTQAHSIKSIQNLRSVTTQYINFLKENYSSRVVQHISKESIYSFLEKKSLEVSGGSLNTYISSAAKLVDNFNKIGINTIERKDIHNMRKEFKNNNINLSKVHTNRAYAKVNEIIKNVSSSSQYSLAIRLQINTGMRIDDLNSKKWKLNEDSSIFIQQSKNGLNYTTVKLDTKLAKEVSEAIKMGYKIDKTEYGKALKEAIEKTGQDFNGSHGLRYNFTKSRMNDLKCDFNYTHSQALSEISLNMGHSREEITEHYLIL